MRGSVAKKNDRWYVVIEDRDPATGARRRRWHSGFRTKREAQAACNELATAMQRGDYLQANRQTVGELALERLATIAPTVRPHRPIKAWTAETLRTFLTATGDAGDTYTKGELGPVGHVVEAAPEHEQRVGHDLVGDIGAGSSAHKPEDGFLHGDHGLAVPIAPSQDRAVRRSHVKHLSSTPFILSVPQRQPSHFGA